MRRTRNQQQKRSSKTRAAQASMEHEILDCLRDGIVLRDLDGNPVISSNLDTFHRMNCDAAQNNGLLGTMEDNPELAKALLKTRQNKSRKNIVFLKGGAR